MKLKEVREDIKGLLPHYSLCNETWESWKRIVRVEKGERECSRQQWIELLAIAALVRKYGRFSFGRKTLEDYLKSCNNDPFSEFPGWSPSERSLILPKSCIGRDLFDLFESIVGVAPSESWFSVHTPKLFKRGFSRDGCFNHAEIQQLFKHYFASRRDSLERRRKQARQARIARKLNQQAA